MSETNGNGKWPLPEGWVWTTVGSVTQPIKKVRPEDEPDKVFTYLDISGIDNKHNVVTDTKTYRGADAPSRARQQVKSGDVLFSTVRTYLKNIAVVPESYDGQVASTGFSILRSESGVHTKYIFYYALTDEFLDELGKLQRGSSYPAVRDSDVRDQPFPLAPLPEQHRIVAEIEKQFTRLDAAVAALRRAKANLARYKAAVLKAAVEGRLVPQDPDDEPADALLERILAERRAQWEAANPKKKYVEPKRPEVDGLPELPVGWVWATVEQITLRIQYGYTASAVYEPVGPKFLRITDIQDGLVDWDAVPWCHCTQAEFEKYRLSSGDIVFARTGATTGKSYLIKDCPESVFASYLIRLQLTNPFDERYLGYYFDSPFYWSRITSEQKGSAQPGVNATILSTLEVPVPPLSEQSRIVNEVERCLSVIHAGDQIINANLARAERLRHGVLGKAFRGELVNLGF